MGTRNAYQQREVGTSPDGSGEFNHIRPSKRLASFSGPNDQQDMMEKGAALSSGMQDIVDWVPKYPQKKAWRL